MPTTTTSTPTENKEAPYVRRSKSITSPEERERIARLMAQPFYYDDNNEQQQERGN
jgi:hypothetical protein